MGVLGMDTKREFIRMLSIAKDTIDEVNDMQQDKGYFSFFTPSGTVVGKFTEGKPLIHKDMDEFREILSKRLKEGTEVSVFDIADGLYNNVIDKLKEENTNLVSDSKSIVLEDVTIYMNNTSKIQVNSFVIFSDQITGIIPGRVQLNL